MPQTDRLGLPLLAAGQAQKELAHNEALLRLDLAIALAVISADAVAPPLAPAPGQCWIVAIGGTGDWAGRDREIAGWTEGGWRFVAPLEGWTAWAIDRGNALRFDGIAWADEAVRGDGLHVAGARVVGARQGAIADPTGGATQDSEARVAIGVILTALRAHGLIES